MATLTEEITADHRAFDDFHRRLQAADSADAYYRGSVGRAFGGLLEDTAKARRWTLATGETLRSGGRSLRVDGVLRDPWRLPRGYWLARASDHSLDDEISARISRGYPIRNTVFEDARQAVLFQNGREVVRAKLSDREQTAYLLTRFYNYDMAAYRAYETAAEALTRDISSVTGALKDKIKAAHLAIPRFKAVYATFVEMCRTALDPDIKQEAVDEMLVQHLLAAPLLDAAAAGTDFLHRNVIAAEIEAVVDALESPYFHRGELRQDLSSFYDAAIAVIKALPDAYNRLAFIHAIDERLLRGGSGKPTSAQGIVQTPQPVVEFICAAIIEVLEAEFSTRPGSPGVTMLDPCAGLGEFVVGMLRQTPRDDLDHFYSRSIYANEMHLLPYYLASLHIEAEYRLLNGDDDTFEGMCLVDSLALGDEPVMVMDGNAERIDRQQAAAISVIMGSPPYTPGAMPGQPVREYEDVDGAIRRTYAAGAELAQTSFDPYVRFLRWATDRLGDDEGVVAFVSNNSFLNHPSFRGLRQHLLEDFTRIYHIDLNGSVRHNPALSRRTHNVLGIQAGVGITIAVRARAHTDRQLRYYRVADSWRRQEKLAWLAAMDRPLQAIPWQRLTPDSRQNWQVTAYAGQYDGFVAMGTNGDADALEAHAIFETFSGGMHVDPEAGLTDFSRDALLNRVRDTLAERGQEVDPARVRTVMTRPFTRQLVYFEPDLLGPLNDQNRFFPTRAAEEENRAIWVKASADWPMFALVSNNMLLDFPPGETRCFPFYVYDADGSNRRENITDWAVEQFRARYKHNGLSKNDIFNYAYGLLHHPEYREHYAGYALHDVPRIPFAPDFAAFRAISDAGRKLIHWHLNYETGRHYNLQWHHDGNNTVSFRVKTMMLTRDKTELRFNDALVMGNIPPEIYEYRLGDRSALEWIIDQFQVWADPRTGILYDPNTYGPERYIVGLVERVVFASLRTVQTMSTLAGLMLVDER